MITLISDDTYLLSECQFVDRSLKQYRFTCRIGSMVLASQWRTAIAPDSSDLIRIAAEADARWGSIGSQTASEFFKNRRGESSEYPLPPDVFAKAKNTWDDYVKSRIRLSQILETANEATEFCELMPERPAADRRTYAYRLQTVWSCRRTLNREQWIALIDHDNRRAQDTLDAALRAPVDTQENTRAISVEVRREVWRRDNGRCMNCGSQERLEFDHIVSVAMGGSSTVRNVQLLCETCNREKGATLG